MTKKISLEDLRPIICGVLVTLLVGFSMNILILGSICVGDRFGTGAVSFLNEMSILVSFTVVPYLFFYKVLKYKVSIPDKHKILMGMLFNILVLVVLLATCDKSLVLHFLVIGVSEETAFRFILNDYLEDQMGTGWALLITSIIFAFVLHLNESIWGNLIIRLPIGLGLGVIKKRFGLDKAIAAHWIYDVVVSTI